MPSTEQSAEPSTKRKAKPSMVITHFFY
jgi:hypothetical protein